MNQKNKFRFCAALIAASSLQQAFAGDLLGTVIDTELNEPLYGAVVKIQNSNTGAVADLNGKFSLRNLKKGTYTLEVSYLLGCPVLRSRFRYCFNNLRCRL